MNFIGQLLNLVFSPLGLMGIVIGSFAVVQAKRLPWLAWFLFSLCCFAASLGKFKDEFVLEPPALVFPLQQLRDMGRPLTIVMLALLLILGMQTQNSWRQQLIPQSVKYLVFVQIVIFTKTLIYGNAGLAVLAILTFGSVILMLKLGPSRWLQNDENFSFAVWSIAMVGVIFVIVNAYQGAIDMNAITFVQGRFLGTTGNPLHATVLLASMVPCLMFLIENSKKWLWGKVFWIAVLAAVAYALFLTGSRTGILMAGTSILFFYRNRSGKLIRLGLIAGVVLVVVIPFFNLDGAILAATDTDLTDRYASAGNTRAGPWSAMWRAFTTYPLFGAPLRGDRLGFGENSWLAAGASLGLFGFVPLVMFGLECMKAILKLNQLSKRQPNYFLHTSTVIAGISSLLVGSVFEAFLLGNLTFSLLVLLTYLLLAQYLVDVASIQFDDFPYQSMFYPIDSEMSLGYMQFPYSSPPQNIE